MQIPIVESRELLNCDDVPRLLMHFSNCCGAWAASYVRPTTGQTPPAIAALLHKQELITIKYSRAHIDLWGRISGFACEVLNQVGIHIESARGQNFSCNLPQSDESLSIVRILCVREPVLGECLQCLCPRDQLFRVQVMSALRHIHLSCNDTPCVALSGQLSPENKTFLPSLQAAGSKFIG